jgi:hypothetical protein
MQWGFVDRRVLHFIDDVLGASGQPNWDGHDNGVLAASEAAL